MVVRDGHSAPMLAVGVFEVSSVRAKVSERVVPGASVLAIRVFVSLGFR